MTQEDNARVRTVPLWCGRDVAVSMTPEHVKPVTFLREIDALFREASGGPGHRVRFSVSRRLQSALFREATPRLRR